MHPGFMHWWKRVQAEAASEGAECAPGCGPGARHHGWHGHHGHRYEAASDEGGAQFGVRRPLRFMAHKLDLDEKQVAGVAKILEDLKIERAQAAVDERRVLSAFADALAGAAFDATKATEAGALRVQTAERLRAAVVNALERTHAILQGEQREKLAYLLRTGALTI